MKKLIILGIVVLSFVLVSGCEKVEEGNYKEGTYFGHVVDNYGGSENDATATIYVDTTGKIASVFLDTTYTKTNGTTTKKSLGDAYNMKTYSSATLEWYEQIELLEKAVIKNQGVSFIKWNDDGKTKTDSVSGVTIQINALYEALQNALNQAKK